MDDENEWIVGARRVRRTLRRTWAGDSDELLIMISNRAARPIVLDAADLISIMALVKLSIVILRRILLDSRLTWPRRQTAASYSPATSVQRLRETLGTDCALPVSILCTTRSFQIDHHQPGSSSSIRSSLWSADRCPSPANTLSSRALAAAEVRLQYRFLLLLCGVQEGQGFENCCPDWKRRGRLVARCLDLLSSHFCCCSTFCLPDDPHRFL